MTRGYFGIGIVGGKTASNVGTLWRSAANFGASMIFTAGHRYPRQATDTVAAWKHVPMLEVPSIDDLVLPKDCLLVGVEQAERADPLPRFAHPERALYLLGAEDRGLPDLILGRCHRVVEIPSQHCLNVAVAGSIVMYDRRAKEGGDA